VSELHVGLGPCKRRREAPKEGNPRRKPWETPK